MLHYRAAERIQYVEVREALFNDQKQKKPSNQQKAEATKKILSVYNTVMNFYGKKRKGIRCVILLFSPGWKSRK